MRQNPQILLTITRVLARTVRMLSDHVDTMAFLRADQRIARYLLSVPEDEEHVIHCTPRGDRPPPSASAESPSAGC